MSNRRAGFVAVLVPLILVAAWGRSEPTATSLPPARLEPTATRTPEPTSTPTLRAEPTRLSSSQAQDEAVTTPSTPTAAPTTTPTATSTGTATHTPTATATPTRTPLPGSALLEPMIHQWQTYNNCCYASVAIMLSYYGHQVSQQEAREQIQALQDDEGPFLRQFRLMSRRYKYPPSRDPIRLLLANGIPVFIVQRLSAERPIGHCRVIHGYDDVAKEFISDDPLLGPGYRIRYGMFVWLSSAGGNFTAIYPPEMDALVQSLMSDMKVSEWTPVQ